jgi:hypothetical protein
MEKQKKESRLTSRIKKIRKSTNEDLAEIIQDRKIVLDITKDHKDQMIYEISKDEKNKRK